MNEFLHFLGDRSYSLHKGYLQFEEAMTAVSRSRFFRGTLAFLLLSAGLFGECLGVLLLVGAVTGHGSPGASILLAVLSFLLLTMSCAFLIAGIINLRRLSQRRS
jgi:hypothetical protein